MRQRAKRPRREKPWVRTRVVLPRPGVPERDTTCPKGRELVFPEGEIADRKIQRGYRRLCTVGVGLVSDAARLLTSFRQRVRRTRGEKSRVRTRILLPRPGDRARGHCRHKERRTGVLCTGHIRPTHVQRGYRQLGTVVFRHFSGVVRADSLDFLPTSEERPEARNHGFGFASCSRGLVFPDGDLAGQKFKHGF